MSGADDLIPEVFDKTLEQAVKDGFEVIRCDDHTLLLDLDSISAYEQYKRVLLTLLEYFTLDGLIEEWESKSGNRHVRIRLAEPQPPLLRFALQAALGSDGVKEILTILRQQNGCENPSVLFRSPAAKLIKADWE